MAQRTHGASRDACPVAAPFYKDITAGGRLTLASAPQLALNQLVKLTAPAGLLIAATFLSAADGSVIPLFNGQNLDGWTFDLKEDVEPSTVWSVQDGVLVCIGKPAGVIRTKGAYGDYELTVEWRWPTGSNGGNSGVLLHASSPRQLDIWPKSIEAQLGAGDAGDFWTIGETIEVSADRKPPEDRRIVNLTDGSEKSFGEWNTMRIRCEGSSVSVWVNVDKVNEGTRCSATRGAVCLQSEGAEIHFRKVELLPLPGKQ
jgi:hypothetical protein